MSALNARTYQSPSISRRRAGSFTPESLEQRALLSASLDLSLQNAFFNPAGSGSQPAVFAPFRIDASRLSLPAEPGAGRIDGQPTTVITTSRIDGPPGTPSIHSGIPATNAVVYQQIDYSKTQPFEKPSLDHEPLRSGKSADQVSPGANPDCTVDWTRFDVFPNVSFTFAGGQITAALPMDGTGRTLDIHILVSGSSLSIPRLSEMRSGHGVIYAKMGSLDEWMGTRPPPPGVNDPLSLEPSRPGQQPPSTPGNDSMPIPARPDTVSPPLSVPNGSQKPTEPVQPPARGELPPGARSDAPVHYVRTHTPATRLGLSDSNAQVVTLTAGDSATANSVPISTAPRLSTSQGANASTTLLLDEGAANESTGSAVQEAARYLVVGSTQLSSLASAAARLFGQATPPSLDGAGETDVESSNLDMSGVLLGLSPWRMAGNQGQNVGRYAWGITAGVSLVVAVGGYWYCQEYVARQRQSTNARPQPSRFPIKAVSRRNREELA